MSREVIIIGGGIAGISAAMEALSRGWRPIILEKTSQLGGRTRSIYARDIGCDIDNGQHVLATRYQQTRQLLKTIGSENKIDFQNRLKVNFALNNDRFIRLRTAYLPSPFHFGIPLLLNKQLSRHDRKALLFFLISIQKMNLASLKTLRVSDWMIQTRQTEFLIKFLWEPLTIATLNSHLSRACAFLLFQVLQSAFLGSPSQCGLGIPRALLNDIFGNPAESFILQKGGSIYFNHSIKRLIIEDGNVQAVQTQNDVFDTPKIIIATPPHALASILTASKYPDSEFLKKLREFEYSPILTIHIWTQQPLKYKLPVAMIDSPVQWIFRQHFENPENLHGYSLVISAGFQQQDLTLDQMLDLINSEFQRFFSVSLFKDLQVIKAKMIKEKRATILQSPESLPLRPAAQSIFPNLSFAGDWIDTGLPATIESAVISGKMACQHLN